MKRIFIRHNYVHECHHIPFNRTHKKKEPKFNMNILNEEHPPIAIFISFELRENCNNQNMELNAANR